MRGPISLAKRLYFWSTGYSYTNLGRLFLRLFVGLMLIQFGVRQMIHFDEVLPTFPDMMGIGQEASLILMIAVEVIPGVFIMAGFLTRLMIVPPFVAMVIAEYYLLHDLSRTAPYLLSWQEPGYVPMLFLGIFFFLLLVGPGKISVDYFLSLHIIHTEDRSEEMELEEV